MWKVERALVYVNTAGRREEAVRRAAELARSQGSRLHLLDVVEPPSPIERTLSWASGPSPLSLADLAAEQARDRLEEIAAPLRAEGLEVTTGLRAGRPWLELVREVIEYRHDLVLKTAESDDRDGIFGATAMHLLRKCPCPVWLVDPREHGVEPRVLAAVDASSDEPEADRLNLRILETAAGLTESGGELLVVHAYQAFGEGLLARRIPQDEFRSYLAEVRSASRDRFSDLLRRSGLGTRVGQALLRNGPAARVILDVARDEAIDLVVMGSLARSGIPGLLIGNTAERVFTRAQFSVLAIKPDGFVSPVSAVETEAAAS